MMQRKRVRTLACWCAALAGIVALSVAGVAAADPPSSVARLAYAEGTVSFSPAGDDQWVRAVVNRPLVAGDRLWSDQGSRGEMQMTNASVRFGPLTSVSLLNLDDRIGQLEIAQGSLQVQVRRMNPGDTVEIDTPNFAFSITRAGSFRFEVDPQDGSTLVAVRTGEGDAYGEGAAYRISAGQVLRFYGTDLRDHENLALGQPEGFERWALSRQSRYEGSVAARYVAPEVVGYEDLDQFGTWQTVAEYGNVWTPRKVPSGWAPYRYGHWAWIDPWGWTWVDDAPWGFAPFHYGRWAFVRERWCWVPGPVRERPVYAPALVAFVGGSNFSVAVASGGAIGWFPLGPGEVYRPAYSVSREYFTRINIANTRVNNTYITNIYNNPDTANVRYANFQRSGGITAVPQAAFAQARPVQRAAVAVNSQVLNKAEILPLAKIAPQRTSVIGASPAVNARPPASVLDKPIVAKAPPPPAPAPIAARLSGQGAEAGRPQEPAASAQAAPGTAPSAQAGQAGPPRRNVNVVQAAKPQAAPTTSSPNAGNRPARAGGPADKPRAESAPPGGGPPAIPPGQQRRAEPPVQATTPPPPQAGSPPGQLRRAEPPAQTTTPSPQAGGPPTAPPGQQRRVEPPAQAVAPPSPQAGGPPTVPPGQQRRVEPPAQAVAPPPSPQAGGPPTAPPGQQRRVEPPAQAVAPPPSPQAGGPPTVPPGQQRRAEPPAQVASPPPGPPPEARVVPQPPRPTPSAPPSVTQAEPRRGPPAERPTPPPQAAPIVPRTPDVAAPRPAPPPPQAEQRRGPPAERPTPPPQATPAAPRGPEAAAARPAPQAAPAAPPQTLQAAPPAPAAQQGPPPREGNPGKGRGDKGDRKEGEPKP